MNTLEDIQAEVAELESRRRHSVLLERAAKAIVEYGQGRVAAVQISARISVNAGGQVEKSVIAHVNYKDRSGFTRCFETLSETLQEIAAELAREEQKGAK